MTSRTINPDKEKKAQAVIDKLLYSPIKEWERIREIINAEQAAEIKSPLRQYVEQHLEIRGGEIKAYYEDAINRGYMKAEEARKYMAVAINAEAQQFLPVLMADTSGYALKAPPCSPSM